MIGKEVPVILILSPGEIIYIPLKLALYVSEMIHEDICAFKCSVCCSDLNEMWMQEAQY